MAEKNQKLLSKLTKDGFRDYYKNHTKTYERDALYDDGAPSRYQMDHLTGRSSHLGMMDAMEIVESFRKLRMDDKLFVEKAIIEMMIELKSTNKNKL